MKTCSRCGEVMHEALHGITKVTGAKGSIDYYCKDCLRILYPKESKLLYEIEIVRYFEKLSEAQEENKDAREC